MITESRHDPQVELRVARSLTGSHAHATPSGSYATDSLGRPILGPDLRQHAGSHAQFNQAAPSSRQYISGRGGRGPSVTLSDPLGGTTHMLNPPTHLHTNRHPDSTRIQVGWACHAQFFLIYNHALYYLLQKCYYIITHKFSLITII